MLKERLSQALLAVVLIGPSLALGGVHPISLALFTGIAAVTLLVVAIGRKGFVVARLDLPAALLVVLSVASLLQITPLPAGLVALLSPAAYEVQAGSLSPLGAEPSRWMILSLDRTLTLMDTGKLLLALCVYLTATIWTRRFGSTFLIQTVIAAGIATAAVFLGHRVLMLDSVYGLYEPRHVLWQATSIHAPLINPNHLAALLGATCAVTIGYTQEVSDRSTRTLLIAIAVLIGGALLLTLSRGGIAAFVAGQLVFLVLVIAARWGRGRSRRGTRQGSVFEITAALVAAIGVGLFAAQDVLVREFAGGDTSKLELLKQALPLLHRFPITGAGRGAFGVALPLVSDHSVGTIFTHPENSVLQALIDFGWVLGSMAILTGMIVFVLLLKAGMRRPRDGAAIAALAAFGVHNLLDFNMETPAVFVILATILATQTGRHSLKVLTGPHLPVPTFAIGGALIIAYAVAIGMYLPDRYLDSEQRLYQQGLDEANSPQFTPSKVREALERHPSDWYIPYAVGVHRYHYRYRYPNDNPLPWLARAIRLNYAAAGAHLYVGRHLLRHGQISQGLLELRLAVSYKPGLLSPAARFAVEAAPSFEMLRAMAPTEELQATIWPALARELIAQGLPDEADRADRAIIEIDPNHTNALDRHARYLAGQGDLAQALAVANRIDKHEKSRIPRVLLLADLSVMGNDTTRALKLVTEALQHSPSDSSLLLKLALIHRTSGDYGAAIQVAGRLAAVSDTEPRKSSALTFKADLHALAGDIDRALATYRLAHTLHPANSRALRRIADLSEKRGDLSRATEALRALRLNDPDNPEWSARLQRLRDLQQRQRFGITP